MLIELLSTAGIALCLFFVIVFVILIVEALEKK
jgi:hypothetical protein